MLTCDIQNVSFTFWVIVCKQLDVKLLGEGGQVRRHHAAGGQVDLVTAGLHLVKRHNRARSGFGFFDGISHTHSLFLHQDSNFQLGQYGSKFPVLFIVLGVRI